ncbi:hypothetical protein Tco_0704107 [Tanacetum coccineum]|uniref:Uncharacterized protein n=1 Tax=Tanacetum coccineum TaxID=301880 RepID=A0ABQ4Y290_9ASTR
MVFFYFNFFILDATTLRRKRDPIVSPKLNRSLQPIKDDSQDLGKCNSQQPPTPDPDRSKRQQVDFRPPQTWISQVARAEEPPTSFDELNDTSFDFYAFVINRLKIPNPTQEILVRPAFNLLKGTCKSITELEYHLEECSKATTERLDWHNPENKPYPFDLRKPLPLIQDHRGCQIIPQGYFINKDLEYLKGGDLSRRYSTSMTKTKAATYNLKWIEDLVHNLWSPYDYGHLEEIEVRRDDQKLYTFKERDFKRLRLQDIEDMLLLLVQQKLTNLTIDERYDLNVALRMYTKRIVIQRRVEDLQLDPHGIIYVDQYKKKRLMRADELHKFSDGTLNDFWSALHDIAARIRMEYLPMRKWSNLDKKRARVMVQDIDKQLYHMSQNRRDLPRDIPLDSVVVLRYEKRSKSENKGKVPTEMELVLEQTQQGTSYEVSVSAEGVEELKRKVKIKGEKKEALLTLRQKPGDGVETQSKVPDEQQQKTSATDEGTGIIPGVPDVPIYESKSEKETWGDSEDEDDENDSDDLSDESDDDNDGNNGNDGDDDDANDDDKQEGDDMNADDEETDKEEEKIDDEEMMYDDKDDEVTKDLYEDVNVNFGNDDTEMTNVDQGTSKQQNVFQQLGFDKEDEDAHVTLTPILDTQKTGGPTQSSSVSSDITSKLLNLDNPSPADNEITFLIDTTTQHATTILEITSSFTTTIPPPPLFFNPLLQQH